MRISRLGPVLPKLLAAATAAATLTSLGLAYADRAPAAMAGTAAGPGDQLWSARYQFGQLNDPRALAVSPGGTRVYVTGTSRSADFDKISTVAYDAASGARLWQAHYGLDSIGEPSAIAVSPDGSTVFVAGSSPAYDYPRFLVIAYRAATGRRIWLASYSRPFTAHAASLAVSPDGKRVYVTGSGNTNGYGEGDSSYRTVSFNAVTGAQMWDAAYDAGVNSTDVASAVAAGPGGRTVFVTGRSGGDYATVAYRAANGARLWVARYNGTGRGDDRAEAIAVSPGGRAVFVTGSSPGAGSHADYATVAYAAATGTRLWTARYNGPGNGRDTAASIAVSPSSGRQVFVTGTSYGGSSNRDFATIAYNAQTGARQWAKRFTGPAAGNDYAKSIGVSPDAATVFVTGTGQTAAGPDYLTLAYQAATGATAWTGRYNGPAGLDDDAAAMAVPRSGHRLFVTGTSADNPSYRSYATIAYRT